MTNKIILELPDKTEVEAENISFIPVSYTHLDVYKRQML